MPSASVARFGNIRRNGFEPSIIGLQQNQMIRSSIFVLALLSLVALGGAACSSVPLTSPTGSTITMTSDRSVLPLNGQATLRAVVIEESGTPVQNGTVVTFTSTLGTVDPVEVKTVNGVATATFNAGSVSGKTSINAFSGGAKTSAATEITIGSAAAKSIALSATPSSVSQSGGTVTVAALVMDESGNPLPGVNVTFSADTGQLTPASALSDSTGVARTQLTTTQTSKVTATAGAATKDVTVTASAAPALQIDVTPASPVEGTPAAINITATSGPTATPRQIQSLTVDFGDGARDTRSNVTGAAAFTHVYSHAGGYTITATAVDVAGNTGVASKAVTVTPATLPTVTVTASPNPIPAADNGLATLSVTASSTGAPLRNVTIRLGTGEVLYSGTGNGSVAFRFTRPGSHTVIGSATDANGNTGTTSIVVVAQ